MSDQDQPTESADPAEPAASRAQAGLAKRLLRGTWRWTKRIALVLIVLLLIARATLGLWLPAVANRAAAPYQLHVAWEDLDLSLLGLSVDLVGLRVIPLPDREFGEGERETYLATQPPLARLDDLGLDADVSALLTGDLRVHRIEVGGLETWLSRDAEGTWNFERHLPRPTIDGADPRPEEDDEPAEATPDVSQTDEAEPEDPTALDFSSPVEVSTIDLHGIRLHLNDALAQPTLDTVLDLELSVRDIGHAERPIEARLTGRADGVLDALRLEAEADLGIAKLLVALDLEIDGVGLEALAPYLLEVGIQPSASKLNARMGATIDLKPLAAASGDGEMVPGQTEEAIDLGGMIRLDSIQLDADGEVAIELMPTTVEVTRARSTAFELKSAVCSGLRARATRLPGGAMRVAGLDFVGAPANSEEVAAEEEPDEATADEPGGPSPSLDLKRFALENVEITFRDEALVEPETLELKVSAEVRSLVLDAARPSVPVSVSLDVRLEGSGAAGLYGSIVPTGEAIIGDLALHGSDLTLATLSPYLEAAGMRSTLNGGVLGGHLGFRVDVGDKLADEPTQVQATLDELSFTDGETLHARLGKLVLRSMTITPGEGTKIGRVGFAEATLPLELFPGGAFRGFGLETLGLNPNAEGRRLGLAEAEINVTDLAFGGAGSSATLNGSFDLISIAEDVQIDGGIVTREGPLDLDASLTLSGKNMSFDGLREVLLAQGMVGDLENGEVRLALEASAKSDEDAGTTQVNGRLYDVALVNRGTDVVAVKEIKITSLTLGPDGTSIENVEVMGPSLVLARDAEGILSAAGLRIGVPAVRPDVMRETEVAVAVAPAATTSAGAATGSEESTRSGDGLVIKRIALEALEVRWADDFVSPAVETAFTARAELLDLNLAAEAPGEPIKLHLEAALEGALRSLTLDGTASVAGGHQSASATLALEGLRAGPLASYLPPTTLVTLEDGRLRMSLDATAAPNAEGGQSLNAAVTELDYRDGANGEPLLAFKSLEFEAPRMDGAAAVYEIERLAMEGFAFDAERTAADRVEVLGLALLRPPTAELPPESPVVTEEGVPDPDTQDENAQGAEPAKPVPAPPSERSLPPTVRLGKLDLGIDRLRYIDRTRADAIPLDLSLALVTPGPQILCLPDPVDLPAIEFSAVGALTPLIKNLTLSTSIEPFAADPGAGIQLLIEGITGSELARIDPAFAASIDPRAYADGSFELTADARLSYARRGPLDFKLDRGFGATISVDTFALKPTPEAVPTGFDRLDVAIKRIQPDTGDIRISSIDLNGLYARVHQSEEGMTVAGFLLPKAPEASETRTEEAIEAPFEDDPAEANPETPGANVANPGAGDTVLAGPEISIDRFTVAGLDFEFLDTTVEPAMRLPIADLQLEVQRFTTRTLVEPRPFSFRAVVDAGEVELEARSGVDNLLFGVLGSAADIVTLKDNEFETESRRVWDLLETSGRLSLGPEPRGRVQLSLLGLELPTFRGPARAAGVEIGDGLLDNRTTVRFREGGALSIDSKTTTAYLSLSEPPGGPITQYLQLPAPLDTVLFLLRNDNGEQQIPIRLNIPADGVSGTRIASLAASTLGTLITDAVSSAPLRVLGPLQNVAGALGLMPEPLTAETVTLEFTEGAATMAAASVKRTTDESERNEELVAGGSPLGNIARALRGNPDLRVVIQADLGEGDLRVAERLANPPRESIEALIEYNRNRKASIERERSQLSARARAQIFAGAAGTDSSDSAPAQDRSDILARLQTLDSERAAVEKALDDLFGFIEAGADRRADMRTRNAALALANKRLERVRLDLLNRVGNAVAQRIDVRRARFRRGSESNPLPPLGLVTVTPK